MNQTTQKNQPILILDRIALRVRDKIIFKGTCWEVRRKQHWAIIGPNGAGKTSLASAIAGKVSFVGGSISYPHFTSLGDQIGYISFESHQLLSANEDTRDASRYFSKDFDSLTTSRQLILAACHLQPHKCRKHFKHVIALLEIEELLDRPIRFLSTGEMRTVLIARELVKLPKLLILDEPFDGLDVNYRARLSRIISQLMEKDTQLILVTHRLAEILPGISHVLGVKDGQVLIQGKREEILVPEQLKRLYTELQPDFKTLPVNFARKENHASNHQKILIDMKNVTVKYGEVFALRNLNWSMKTGENWMIIGPNGSGKTTLLSLIAGDHLHAYRNEIYLFGRPRSSGESIWDLKRKIGLISSEFQIRYRKPITTFEVVLSGFFDSVGLYRSGTLAQQEVTKKWMKLLNIEDKSDRRFNTLSYGEQRRTLLARAMVKSPLLLLLDEPCQGLDRSARKMMINLIDFIGRHTTTHILYVTHHQKEWPMCITHILQFNKTMNGNITAFSRSID